MSDSNKLSKEQKQALGLLSVGTFLEYFDLMLYIHMAVLLNELFFPKTDPFTASLLSAFAFCSTYLLRPFGALIFGYIGDHIGRKHTVIITTFMMSISCIVMANLPTYEQIGITAAWIITVCRIVQGMSSMGEVIGSELYVTEITKPPTQYVAVGIITVFASIGGMGALFVSWYTTNYGLNWRIAFWIGAAIALVGSSARMLLRETPEFADARKRLSEYKKDNKLYYEKVKFKSALSLYLVQCAWPMCFYFVYIHCSTILKNSFGLSSPEVISHNLILSIIQVSSFLIFTVSSYWIYPLLLLKIKVIFFIIGVILLVLIGTNSDYYTFFVLQSIVTFFMLSYSSAMPIFYKHIPVFKRFTYASMLYAISRAFIYLITSFGLVYITHYLGNWGILVIVLSVVAGFIYAIFYFEQMEVAVGSYPKLKEGYISSA